MFRLRRRSPADRDQAGTASLIPGVSAPARHKYDASDGVTGDGDGAGGRVYAQRKFSGNGQFRTSLLQEARGSGGLGPGALEIALAKIIRDLVQRALFPLFGFSEPKNPALGIERRALSAEKFLPADFNELVHELHSSVKPTNL